MGGARIVLRHYTVANTNKAHSKSLPVDRRCATILLLANHQLVSVVKFHMSVLVFGHRNPDTDAICSAIAYADLLQQTTRPEAVAACCGAPNKRTEYVLRTAKVPAPRIVMDVRPEVEDVCQRNVKTARYGDVFFEVYNRMKEHDLRDRKSVV